MTKQTLNPLATVRVNAPCVCVCADLPLRAHCPQRVAFYSRNRTCLLFARCTFSLSVGWLTRQRRLELQLNPTFIPNITQFVRFVRKSSKQKQEFASVLKHFLIIFSSVCDGTGVLLLRRLQARGEARLGLAEETGQSRSTESS